MPDKLKMHSPDLTDANVAKLLELFPGVATETKDAATGETVRGVDFDLLRQELSDHVVEGPRERYHLDWPGKREAMLAANAPIAKTLRPVRDESVNFDTTQNLFIEGDNLEALKLLQETYLGKVKMIFIDPPYNTGKEFIYDDDFAEDAGDYKLRSGQTDEDGARMVANTEANGRYHSDWLSMMLPRLKLARNLLRDDGTIVITISDHEVANLRSICDEVFGHDNFIACVVWEKVHTRKNSTKTFSVSHDFALVYAKSKSVWDRMLFPRDEASRSSYTNPDNHPKGPWKIDPVTARNEYSADYQITKPNGVVLLRPKDRYWAFSEETWLEKVRNGEVVWGEGSAYPSIKRFLAEVQDGLVPTTIFKRTFAGDSSVAKGELRALLGDSIAFDYPKPTLLIRRFIQLFVRPDDIILDFFAGSGTLGDAVEQENATDAGRRRFIAIQVDASIGSEVSANSTDLKTIADLAKRRLSKVNERSEQRKNGSSQDAGFRVLKIDSSNLKDIHYTPDQTAQQSLGNFVDHIKDDRSDEDLLFQVMLDWGVDLGAPIASETIAGRTVWFVAGNALAACFDTGLDDAFVKALAQRGEAADKPLRVVFRDAGFADDDAKINAEQIFKTLSPATEVKVL